METFTIELTKDRTEIVDADAYQQEGPLTTFFAIDSARTTIDSWSRRIASFRTADVVAVRSKRPQRQIAPRRSGHRARCRSQRSVHLLNSSPLIGLGDR